MANALYNSLKPQMNNGMLERLKAFKQNFTGDPQQIVQNMINSGRITQAQVNAYAQQANEIYKQLKR